MKSLQGYSSYLKNVYSDNDKINNATYRVRTKKGSKMDCIKPKRYMKRIDLNELRVNIQLPN